MLCMLRKQIPAIYHCTFSRDAYVTLRCGLCLLIFSTEFFWCSNIDDVDKTMDEINEQTENMKQIQEALSAPMGAAADFDEVHCSF